MATWRIIDHPILGAAPADRTVIIDFDGRPVEAIEGEPIAAALMAAGVASFRTTPVRHEPRGVFCAIGRCTDCVMTVDGVPNVRTCVTPARDGMIVRTQHGLGEWSDSGCGDSN
ncbi:MAG: (2Fe-2S)-binding protein [Firmicutes bacterium]|nr:(2Fe-2S)-binding protein [Bacillota bacterium]